MPRPSRQVFVAALITLFSVTDLSAITAVICMGREAHEDSRKRYTAAVSCIAIYMIIGDSGAAITGLLTTFPKGLVVAIAGLALLGTIGNGLATALKDEMHREAALITVLVTLLGVVMPVLAQPSGVWWRAWWRCLYNNTGKPKLATPPRTPSHEHSFRRRSARIFQNP